jgi:hypothetical protein
MISRWKSVPVLTISFHKRRYPLLNETTLFSPDPWETARERAMRPERWKESQIVAARTSKFSSLRSDNFHANRLWSLASCGKNSRAR